MLSSVPTDTKLTVFWAIRYTPYRHIHWTLFSTHLKRKTLHLINQWSHERIIMITEEELFCIGIKCEIFPLAELYHYSWAWWIMNMKICATNENNNLFGKKLTSSFLSFFHYWGFLLPSTTVLKTFIEFWQKDNLRIFIFLSNCNYNSSQNGLPFVWPCLFSK